MEENATERNLYIQPFHGGLPSPSISLNVSSCEIVACDKMYPDADGAPAELAPQYDFLQLSFIL